MMNSYINFLLEKNQILGYNRKKNNFSEVKYEVFNRTPATKI